MDTKEKLESPHVVSYDSMDLDQCIHQFRKKGAVAFCPVCGALKKDYRDVCKACKTNPRKDDRLFARGILMSTQEFFMRSARWKSMSREKIGELMEGEIVPELFRNAETLRTGGSVTFKDENYWLKRLAREKGIKMPLSGYLILILLYGFIAAVIVLAVKYFFF